MGSSCWFNTPLWVQWGILIVFSHANSFPSLTALLRLRQKNKDTRGQIELKYYGQLKHRGEKSLQDLSCFFVICIPIYKFCFFWSCGQCLPAKVQSFSLSEGSKVPRSAKRMGMREGRVRGTGREGKLGAPWQDQGRVWIAVFAPGVSYDFQLLKSYNPSSSFKTLQNMINTFCLSPLFLPRHFPLLCAVKICTYRRQKFSLFNVQNYWWRHYESLAILG